MSEFLITLKDVIKMVDDSFPFEQGKLVRHKSSEYDFDELVRSDLLEEYQSLQSKPVFDNCNYVISFLATEGTKAILKGVYRVDGKPEKGLFEVLASSELKALLKDHAKNTQSYHRYKLTRLNNFDGLKDRIIIDWGKAALSWHQYATNEKPVIEVLPEGYVKDFPGYLDFVLDFHELKQIIGNSDANKVWHQMLSGQAGIYLISDRKTGAQYVGSAYGKEGILQRWQTYVDKNMKENQQLIALMDAHLDEYAKNFRFTILRILPKTMQKDEVIRYENLYKEKLGTRVFGLNSN